MRFAVAMSNILTYFNLIYFVMTSALESFIYTILITSFSAKFVTLPGQISSIQLMSWVVDTRLLQSQTRHRIILFKLISADRRKWNLQTNICGSDGCTVIWSLLLPLFLSFGFQISSKYLLFKSFYFSKQPWPCPASGLVWALRHWVVSLMGR